MEKVVLSLEFDETRNFKWIKFTFDEDRLLTASIDDPNAVGENWFAAVGYVHVCGREMEDYFLYHFYRGQMHYTLPDHRCCKRFATRVIAVWLYDGKTVYVSETRSLSRFTDEAQAKQLNANCKFRFEDSEETIYMKQELLAVYSPVFRAMFEGDFKEKNAEEVKFKDLKKEDFLAFLECLYQLATPIKNQTLEAIHLVADRYDCLVAMEMCKEFMSKKRLETLEDYKKYVELIQRYKFTDVLAHILSVDPKTHMAQMLVLL